MFNSSSRFDAQLLLALLYILNGPIVIAQENEMATDRPDQTEASSVVGKGVVQIETGLVFSRKDLFYGHLEMDLLKTRDFATTLLRYGIHKNIELRLATAYTVNKLTNLSAESSGLQPVSVGTKIAIAKEKGIWPEIAFIGHLTLPWIGDELFVPDDITPDFRFSLSHTLSERFSLGYNLGVEWENGTDAGSILYSIALGASLFGPVSGFIESYGDTAGSLGRADYGLTVLITPDIQLDASHGFCWSVCDREHFFNAGISARFGGKTE